MRATRRHTLLACAVAIALSVGAATPALADTTPPVITVTAPTANAAFGDELHLSASATDPDGLGRISFLADGKPIRSFTIGLRNGVPVHLDWKGARGLSYGRHTITVVALDRRNSNPVTGGENTATATVEVRHLNIAAVPRATTTVSIRISGSGRTRTVRGAVSAPVTAFPAAVFPLAGKVRVTWQVFSNGRFKTRHKDSSDVLAPYAFTQRLAEKGRWRVQVQYDPERPYRPSSSRVVSFTVT